MKDLFAKINAEIETFKTESELHIDKGNKAAGTRVRNAMQQFKVLAQEIRTEVTEKKAQ